VQSVALVVLGVPVVTEAPAMQLMARLLQAMQALVAKVVMAKTVLTVVRCWTSTAPKTMRAS
jgi:hypothetical protein